MSGNSNSSGDNGLGCQALVWLGLGLVALACGGLASLLGYKDTAQEALNSAGGAFSLFVMFFGMAVLITIVSALFSGIKNAWTKAKQVGRRQQSTQSQAQDMQKLLLLIYQTQGQQGLEAYLQSAGIPSHQINDIVEVIQLADV